MMKREQVLPLVAQIKEIIKDSVATVYITAISDHIFEFRLETQQQDFDSLMTKLYAKFPKVEAVLCHPVDHGTHRLRVIWPCNHKEKKDWEEED